MYSCANRNYCYISGSTQYRIECTGYSISFNMQSKIIQQLEIPPANLYITLWFCIISPYESSADNMAPKLYSKLYIPRLSSLRVENCDNNLSRCDGYKYTTWTWTTFNALEWSQSFGYGSCCLCICWWTRFQLCTSLWGTQVEMMYLPL